MLQWPPSQATCRGVRPHYQYIQLQVTRVTCTQDKKSLCAYVVVAQNKSARLQQRFDESVMSQAAAVMHRTLPILQAQYSTVRHNNRAHISSYPVSMPSGSTHAVSVIDVCPLFQFLS